MKGDQAMTYATLGTVTSGTLRDEDLLNAFSDCLFSLTCAAIGKGQIDGIDAGDHMQLVFDARRAVYDIEKFEGDVSEIISELIDALDTFAPPCAYFGANEGDGADFGFWVQDIDDLEGVVKLDELPDMIAVVSDHGNVTLYTIEAWEAWSIV